MSKRHRALGVQFDLPADRLRDMVSDEYGVHMDEALDAMRAEWESSNGDPDKVHSNDHAHGGPDNYIEKLKGDIAQRGVLTPILVRGNAVKEGHHRAVAALALGLRSIPAMETPR